MIFRRWSSLMLLTSAAAAPASVARTRAELSTSARAVGADLVEVAEDFAVLGALPGVHDADHFPVAAAERELFAQRGAGITLGDRLADHHLALAGLEPAAARRS